MMLPCKIPTLRNLKVRLVTIFSPAFDKCDRLSQENPINKFLKKVVSSLFVYMFTDCTLHLKVRHLLNAIGLQFWNRACLCWAIFHQLLCIYVSHALIRCRRCNLTSSYSYWILRRLKNCKKYLCGLLLYNLNSFSRWLKNIFNDEFTWISAPECYHFQHIWTPRAADMSINI